ncbi:hypothetical protein PBRA_001554 [Plasmodiophora brassicae]|uniref:PPIase cyclophilin-type domain-containing protein n=1 Tax=Plasmodiophora brassicae TaxID=37360 RepID=A0A0G4IYU1_PLABS|nr:hypothetical protein PBRA_001554 [Plasmodiophora brassicae]
MHPGAVSRRKTVKLWCDMFRSTSKRRTMSTGTLVVSGRMLSPVYQEAKAIAQKIRDVASDQQKVQIVDVLDIDWDIELHQVTLRYGAHIVGHCPDVFICHSSLGWVGGTTADLLQWAAPRFDLGPTEGTPDFEALAKESLSLYCKKNSKVATRQHSGCHMFKDVTGKPIRLHDSFSNSFILSCRGHVITSACCARENSGRLRMAYLFITRAAQFIESSKGLGFKAEVRRSVSKQCGSSTGLGDAAIDIATGNGDGGESAFGSFFEDECFAIKHDRPGILSMANEGRPHSNGSQFFITLRDLEYLDCKKVAFGRVISGLDIVRRIGKSSTLNERPTQPIIVSDCGVYVPDH